MLNYDFLVIGAGISGLTFAIEVAKKGSVAVICKKGFLNSSTAWAQGGIAAVSNPADSYELHIKDTLTAGAGLCDEEIVRQVVTEGPERVQELIDRGVEFDRMPDGKDYHLHKEGGHSKRRIFHSTDQTGYEIQTSLLKCVNAESAIDLYEYSNAVDLITSTRVGKSKKQPRILGAYVLMPDGSVKVFRARSVLVATGGAGKVYLYTSNPDVASGDGIAMCYRAGCSVANMEFFQFHPTCLFDPKAKSFLISEALRGEGAKLRRINGQEFMKSYDSRAELASRDIVARAIDHEMKLHGEEYVNLDISHRESGFIKEHFPKIHSTCLKYGYDLTKGPIPVVPAAHYCCGGVVSDANGATSIAGLYVAGECAHTGLHGANRLASNSLLEGVVFAHRAAKEAIATLVDQNDWPIPDWDPGSAVDSDEQVVITQNWDEIRRCMWNYVGIVRTDKRLKRALSRIENIEREIDEYYWNFLVTSDLLELRNLCLVAKLLVQSAMKRKESRGLHFTLDYPDLLPEARDTVMAG